MDGERRMGFWGSSYVKLMDGKVLVGSSVMVFHVRRTWG